MSAGLGPPHRPRRPRMSGNFPVGCEVECGRSPEKQCRTLASSADSSNFERLLTDISTKFINAAPANVDAEITSALRSLVEFLAVDRSTLFQWSADGRYLENTHHWVVEGCEPVPPVIAQRGPAVFPSQGPRGPPLLVLQPGRSFRRKRRRTAHFSRSTDHGPTCRSRWSREGPSWARSASACCGRSACGLTSLKERLSVVAHVFANALERKRSDLALQHAYAEVTQLKERLELDNQYLRQELETDAGDDAIVAQSAGDESRAARGQASGRHGFNGAVVRRDGHGQGAPR